jgi:hypothetical protein
MLDRRDCLSICTYMSLDHTMANKLFGSIGVLSLGQPPKLFGTDSTGEAELFRNLAVPLTQSCVTLPPVILLRRGELFSMVPPCPGCGERSRDGQHT